MNKRKLESAVNNGMEKSRGDQFKAFIIQHQSIQVFAAKAYWRINMFWRKSDCVVEDLFKPTDLSIF